MVPYHVQLSVYHAPHTMDVAHELHRFPLDIVFRIYDNVLASGIESIFGFSVILLMKNEEELLKLKFDDILTFLKNRLFDKYIVSFSSMIYAVINVYSFRLLMKRALQ